MKLRKITTIFLCFCSFNSFAISNDNNFFEYKEEVNEQKQNGFNIENPSVRFELEQMIQSIITMNNQNNPMSDIGKKFEDSEYGIDYFNYSNYQIIGENDLFVMIKDSSGNRKIVNKENINDIKNEIIKYHEKTIKEQNLLSQLAEKFDSSARESARVFDINENGNNKK